MSTQNVTINNTPYPSVPAVEIPKTGGGGNAVFVEISDTNATAADVAAGKIFYTASGSRTTGTATGGGVVTITDTSGPYGGIVREITADSLLVVTSASFTANGTYSGASTSSYHEVWNQVTVNVAGGSGGGNIQANKNATPSESTLYVTPDTGYDGMAQVTVAAISSDYVGSSIPRCTSSNLTASGSTVTAASGYYTSAASTNISAGTVNNPTASKGTVSNHAISVTPSVSYTSGYIAAGSKNGTAVSVSASELVSGTLSVTSAGTKDVTNYASASIPSGTAGTPTASKGSVSNHTISVTPSVTNTTGFITGSTINGTAATVSASELVSGSQTITNNNTYDVTNLASVIVNVSGGGGGGGGITVASASKTLTSASSSIQFTSLAGEPTSFVIVSLADQTTGGNKVTGVVYDGTSLHGQTLTTQVTASTAFSQSYSSGTLTVTATSASFQANEYKLVYTYGGSTSDISTVDVQVGSGATSITFTGLSEEPSYFSCIFKSDFSTSSGYQRVIEVVFDGTSTYGMEMDSSAKYSTAHWSYTYNNGSLTISSQGTNAGGYFHQPGYYQLTYANESSSGNYQTKTVTPTTSAQNVTADSGYDALQKVVVEAIPSSYVQPTTTVGATTYRAATTSQTINAGTYHSAAATIAAVTATNLSAANIKSGTTISVSNGQSNLWSVTGTYDGGGGTAMNVQTVQSTSRRNNTALGSITSLTCSTAGTYTVYWTCARSNTSQTWGSQLYIGGTAYGTENTTWSNNVQNNKLTGVTIAANATVAVYGRSRSGYYIYAPQLTIEQTS